MYMYVIGVESPIRAVNVSEMPVSVHHVVSKPTIEHTKSTLLQEPGRYPNPRPGQ